MYIEKNIDINQWFNLEKLLSFTSFILIKHSTLINLFNSFTEH